jgi:hypothetical protein
MGACGLPVLLLIYCHIYYHCSLSGYLKRRMAERRRFQTLLKDPYYAAGRLKEQQKMFLTAIIRMYDSSPMGRNLVSSVWMNFRGIKSSKGGPPVAFVKEYFDELNIGELAPGAPVLAAAGVSIGSEALAIENMLKVLLYTRVVVKRDIDRTKVRFAFSNESFMPVLANAEFEKADEDGGGTLDMEEIVGLTEDLTRRFKIKALPVDEIMAIFRESDKRGRQELDKVEFLPFLRRVLKLSLDSYDKAQQDLLERFSAENMRSRTKKIMRVKKDEKARLLEKKEESKLGNFLVYVGAAEPEKRIEDEFSILTDDYSNEFIVEGGLVMEKLMDDISDLGEDFESADRAAYPFEPALFSEVGGDKVFGDIAGFDRAYKKKGDDKLEVEIEIGLPRQPQRYRRGYSWKVPGEATKADALRALREKERELQGKGKGKGKGKGRGRGRGKGKGKGAAAAGRRPSSASPAPARPAAKTLPPPVMDDMDMGDGDDDDGAGAEADPPALVSPQQEENVDDLMNQV